MLAGQGAVVRQFNKVMLLLNAHTCCTFLCAWLSALILSWFSTSVAHSPHSLQHDHDQRVHASYTQLSTQHNATRQKLLRQAAATAAASRFQPADTCHLLCLNDREYVMPSKHITFKLSATAENVKLQKVCPAHHSLINAVYAQAQLTHQSCH
jgi:hypothetical protein